MASFIGRRRFLATLGGSAVAWPLAARAQQPERMRRGGGVVDALGSRDREASKAERLGAYAVELVAPNPDVIVAAATPALERLKQATQTIPIVFVQVSDPVGGGFVPSLARPGGNITGFALYEYSIVVKWLELLKQLA